MPISSRHPVPRLGWLLLALLLPLASLAQETDPGELFRDALRNRVGLPENPDTLVVDGLVLASRDAVIRLYLTREFTPVWIDANGRPIAAAGRFVERARGIATEGLDPAAYRVDELARRLRSLEADAGTLDELVAVDLLLSDAWLTLARHLLRGRVDPERLFGQWLATPREFDLVSLLDTALASGDPVDALDELEPAYPGYARLREALARLRAIDPASEPPRVASGFALRLGNEDERLPAIRRRLRFHGDLPEGASLDDTRFDGQVDAALLSFQARHGLEADGIFGRGTRDALNAPVAERIAQVELNMERYRWLPKTPEPRYLRVNIADFRLDLVEEQVPVMSMDVIVGRSYRQTPVFSEKMTYLVFSPAWHIPPTIARKDILPRLRKDPAGVAADRIRVLSGWGENEREIDPMTVDWSRVSERNLPYHFRQDPGPQNALGRVKFMFPNRFSVYMHDTPARQLFDRAQRDFSSGCIRVERPRDLAVHLLLEDPAWTPEKIDEAMAAGRERTVTLPRTIPVHIRYQTAWVDDDGQLQFRQDIYDRDARLREALEEIGR
ncbi:MAG: L,D-transpeptidase family protein [Gammaproteobacteria bacterium]|nr:L,D-transpeptidase family protein [Gammaproteobacteria bacterium]